MIPWYQQVKDRLVFFDTETGGLHQGQDVFSWAWHEKGKTTPNFVDINRGERTGKFSFFSNELIQKTKGFSGGKWNTQDGPVWSKDIASAMLSKQMMEHLQAGKIIAGHNIGFDMSVVSENMSTTLMDRAKVILGQPLNGSDILAADPKLKPKDFGKQYQALVERMTANKGADIVGTDYMTRLLYGMAEEKGIVDFQGDYWSGSKLENITDFMGLQSQAHDFTDVQYNAQAWDFLGQSLEEVHNGNISPKTKAFLEHIKSERPKLVHERLHSDLSSKAEEQVWKRFHGQDETITLQTLKGQKRVPNPGMQTTDPDKIFELNHFSREGYYQKIYGYQPEDFKNIFQNYKSSYSQIFDDVMSTVNGRDNQFDELSKRITAQKKLDFQKTFPSARKIVEETVEEVPTPKAGMFSELAGNLKRMPTWGKVALGAGAIVAGLGLKSLFSRKDEDYGKLQAKISGRTGAYNSIQGLHPGDGVNKDMTDAHTDFGSPYKGLGYTAAIAIGLKKGWHMGRMERKENESKGKKTSFLGAAGTFALSFIDDAAVMGAMILGGKYGGAKVKKIVNSAPVSMFMWGMNAMAVAKVAGMLIPSKDDHYNTIEGLHPGDGVNKDQIQRMTDFGSGYKGPNPQIQPDYNEKKEVYRYELMRASKIGLSESEMYKYMTEEDPETSEYVSASASAGTALHQYQQSLAFKRGTASDYEKLAVNQEHGITGHIDIIDREMGIGDYKTVSSGIFKKIMAEGEAKPMHRAQVQYYLGTMGEDRGFIQYINRANPHQKRTFIVNYNPREYENLISKVERTRARVMEDIEHGRLRKGNLPMTASLETLQEDEGERLSPLEMAEKTQEHQKIFKEEMNYLNSIKRGMPSQGEGYQRVQEANRKRKREEFFAQSTQGIGLFMHNNRTGHHVM